MSSTQESSSSGKMPRVEAAVLIAVLTALAYLGAYRFEVGYIGHFGVPQVLAEVDIRDLLVAGSMLATATMLLGSLMDFLYGLSSESLSARARRNLVVTVGTLSGFAVLIFLAGELWYLVVIMFLLIGSPMWVTMVREWVVPIVNRPAGTTYAQRVDAALDKTRPPLGKGLKALSQKVGERTVGFMLAALILFGLAHDFGRYYARWQSEFLVAETWEPCVVIRATSRGLLCVDYDAGRHVALPSYRFLEPSSARLNLRQVGPLPPVRAPTSSAH